jgi:hypothetical protein
MTELPRWLIPVIRLALALSLVGITAFQLIGVPAIAWHDLKRHSSVGEVAFITPLVVIFIGGAACLQLIIACTWHLLSLVTRGEIFSDASSRWVNGIVRAMAAGWVLLALLAPYAYVIATSGDAPGILLMGLMLGLVATAVLGLMLILRELLRRATELRSDMDAVI